MEARKVLGSSVGLKRLKDYVKATYGEIDDDDMREFQRGNVNSQLFGPPPASEGKMATLGPKDSWYLDLMSMPRGDKTYKHIMTAQNVYSGFLYALPLKTTTPSGPDGSAAVFRQMLDQSVADGQGPPKTVTTDGSTTEWSGPFLKLLSEREIIRRPKEPSDANAMGKLDATQQSLRAFLKPDVDGSNAKQDWSERLPEIVKTYNERLGHEGSFGSVPKDVISKEPTENTEKNALDFQVMRQMARNLRANTALNQKNRDAAVAEGAFRTSEWFEKDKPFDKHSRITRIRYSEAVGQVDGEEGPYIKDAKGKLHNPKLIKAVPAESESVDAPAELKKGTYDNRIKQKEKLWEVAKILHAWLKTQHAGAANITITNRYKDDPVFKAALNPGNVQLGFLKLGKEGERRKITEKPVAIAKLFQGWFAHKDPDNPKDQMWIAKGTMPVAFKAKPDPEDIEENAASRPEPVPQSPRQGRFRLRRPTKREVFNPKYTNTKQEFRERYLGTLRLWLLEGDPPRRVASAADVMRRLREMRGFTSFARANPSYAKASNLAALYPETLRVVPGGTTVNPRIALNDQPAPVAERGPVIEPPRTATDKEAPKGPRRPPGLPAGTPGGLGAMLQARRREADARFEALFE